MLVAAKSITTTTIIKKIIAIADFGDVTEIFCFFLFASLLLLLYLFISQKEFFYYHILPAGREINIGIWKGSGFAELLEQAR